MIKGNLASFSLGEIFQSLAVNHHTGTLKILEKDGREKFVYFSKGEICLFSEKSHPNLRIGEILVRKGKISKEDLNTALDLQKESREKLGQILIKKLGLSPEDIQDSLVTKIYDEIYDLFLLTDAEFEFYVDHFPEEVFESFPDNVRISINTYSVVMEGLRVADEWKLIQKKIKTFNEIFVFTSQVSPASFQSPLDRALTPLIDGSTPVRGLFDTFPGNRFECCKTIFGFLGAGIIRPLTIDECRDKSGKAGKGGDLQKALDFLRFAVELAPGKPEPLILVGSLLERLGQEDEGRQSIYEAIKIFHHDGQSEQVVAHGEALVPFFNRDIEFLEIVFDAAVRNSKVGLVQASGEALAACHIGKGSKGQAATVLLKVAGFVPRDTDLKMRAATALRECGQASEAIAIFEQVAASYTSRQKAAEKIRVLRAILDLAPDRQDIKQEITGLLAQQERWELKKKRRFTIAGAAIIALLLLLLIPVLYEIKARELISHANRLEEISLASGDYTVAKSSYQRVINSFGLSTQAKKAEIAIERIATLERVKEMTIDQEKRRQSEVHEARIAEAQRNLVRLFELAGELEAKGDVQGSFQILSKLIEDYPENPRARAMQLPLAITSNPPGASVKIEGREVGKTPLVVRRKRNDVVSFELSRSGCEPAQMDVIVGDHWQSHVDLQIRPVARFNVSGAIHQPVRLVNGILYFSARDGFYYCVHPTEQSLIWRRLCGKFGDLLSPEVFTEMEVLFGNVRGELAAVSLETGKSRWRTQLRGPVLAAPAISADGRWVGAGDLAGNLVILEYATGKPLSSFRTENEIVHALRFWGDTLVATSADNSLYMISANDGKVSHTEMFDDDFETDPLLSGDRLLLTLQGGRLLCFHLGNRAVEWTRDLGSAVSSAGKIIQDTVVLGTSDGRLVATRIDDGAPAWEMKVSTAALGDLLIHQGAAYLGTQNGEMIGIDLSTRKIRWTYRVQESVARAPVAIGERLYFATPNGEFVILEIFR